MKICPIMLRNIIGQMLNVKKWYFCLFLLLIGKSHSPCRKKEKTKKRKFWTDFQLNKRANFGRFSLYSTYIYIVIYLFAAANFAFFHLSPVI